MEAKTFNLTFKYMYIGDALPINNQLIHPKELAIK